MNRCPILNGNRDKADGSARRATVIIQKDSACLSDLIEIHPCNILIYNLT
jgi:hypothetical protein